MKKEDVLAIHATLVCNEYDSIVAQCTPEEKQAAVLAELKRRGGVTVPTLELVREDAHKCPLCAATFKWPSHLVRHLKSSHGAKGEDGDEPNGDEPKGDQPKTDEPKTDEPKGDQPKGDQPKGDQPKTAKASYTRSKNYGSKNSEGDTDEPGFETFTKKLVASLYDHASAAYHERPDPFVQKVGRFYHANVYTFCRAEKCDPKYGLFCFGFLGHFGTDLIRGIKTVSDSPRKTKVVLVLNTSFVSEGPNYYQKRLTALKTELKAAMWPWKSTNKPSGFPVVLDYIAKLPRRSDKAKKADDDPEPDEDFPPPPKMTNNSKFTHFRQKMKMLRMDGPGQAAPGEELA